MLFFVFGNVGEGRAIHCVFNLRVCHMGINFCSGNMLMSKYFTQYPNIDTAMLIHQSSGSVTKFMGGQAFFVQTGTLQARFYDLLHTSFADSCAISG